MFLLRSAFWLTAAYLVVAPHPDLRGDVGTLSSQALAAGQQAVAEQIRNAPCDTLECQGGKALLSVVLTSTPSSGSTMQEPPAPVPIPRPRPDWMG